MVNVAVLGYGVVGSGAVELLTGTGEGQTKKADDLVELKYILDIRDFSDSPFANCFVKDFSVIENDPEIDIVVEAIGGAGVALEFTERALKAGKSVVTSNKEVVAKHGSRLLQLAKENNAIYLFEASVGGGIPVLRPLSECMAANEILEICGILNGTTNYIFSRMIDAGLSFADALKEAQEKGFAEQDPTADVEGFDACRKICILASIAFGFHVLPEQVQTTGISNVTLEDVAYAESTAHKIKLLGRAIYNQDGTICAYVEPHFVKNENPLSSVEGVFNAVTIKGTATGDVMFYGQGAGKLPTASAVVADVIAIARQMERSAYRLWSEPRLEGTVSADTLSNVWYVRLLEDTLDNAEKIEAANENSTENAYFTLPMTRPEVDAQLEGKKVLSIIRVLD